MSIKLLAGLAGAVLFSTAASAQFTTSLTGPPSTWGSATARGDATGDLSTAVINGTGGAFSEDFGGILGHEIGSTEAFPTDAGISASSEIIDNMDGTRTLNMTWATNDGTVLFGTDHFGVGSGVTSINFFLGADSMGLESDGVLDPDYAGIADPDADMDGVFEASFSLLDAAGASLFDGTFFVFDFGTSFGGLVFLSAGGGDLGGFGIGGASASITYNVIPAPGAAALFGLGGLAAVRRRR